MTVLHATEPATVYLSCWARGSSTQIADVDRALCQDRSLVMQLAMRRTLFAFPRDLLAAAWGSASARVAGVQRTRMAKDLVNAGLARDGEQWLERARGEVLSVLAEHPDGLLAFELRKLVARMRGRAPPPTAIARSFVAGCPRSARHEDDLVWWLGRPRPRCVWPSPSSPPSRSPSITASTAGWRPDPSSGPARARRLVSDSCPNVGPRYLDAAPLLTRPRASVGRRTSGSR